MNYKDLVILFSVLNPMQFVCFLRSNDGSSIVTDYVKNLYHLSDYIKMTDRIESITYRENTMYISIE